VGQLGLEQALKVWVPRKELDHQHNLRLWPRHLQIKSNYLAKPIYPKIQVMQHELAGKSTGMLLEMDKPELMSL
jgi:hypothetical protein